jgi:hypothetical protein
MERVKVRGLHRRQDGLAVAHHALADHPAHDLDDAAALEARQAVGH